MFVMDEPKVASCERPKWLPADRLWPNGCHTIGEMEYQQELAQKNAQNEATAYAIFATLIVLVIVGLILIRIRRAI